MRICKCLSAQISLKLIVLMQGKNDKQILHVFAEGIQMGSKQLKLNKEQKEVYVAFVV